MPSYTVRPDLTIELWRANDARRKRERLSLEDYDSVADVDVSGVVDRDVRRGKKLIQCRLRSIAGRGETPYYNPKNPPPSSTSTS